MRILVFSHYFWPEEFRINDCVAGLVERGHQVTVVCGPPSYPKGRVYPDYAANPEAFKAYKGATVVRVPALTRGRGGALRLLANYLSAAVSAATLGLVKLRGQAFDVVFVFQPSPITTALPAILWKRLTGTAVVMWVQDLWPETLEAVGIIRSRASVAAVGSLVRFIYAACDRILMQSQAFAASVKRYAPTATPATYLPNWSDPAFATVPTCPAPEVTAVAGDFSIMFAGNLGQAQDLPTVIRAAGLCRHLKGLRWLIVGDGSARTAAEAQVAELDLQDRVRFLGRHLGDRMPAFFAGADALLISLKAEMIFEMTVPSKLQSYMASGRPILCMVGGEAARLVEEAKCGLTVPPGDAAALAEVVAKMVGLSEMERRIMGDNGLRYGQLNFARDALINRLESELAAAAMR